MAMKRTTADKSSNTRLPKGKLTLDLNPVEAFQRPEGMIYQAPIYEVTESALPKGKSLIQKLLYRYGRASGKWWTPDRKYADWYKAPSRPLQQKSIDFSKLRTLDARVKGEADFLKNLKPDAIDKTLKGKGYDAVISESEIGTPMYYFVEPLRWLK